jgi:dienelactone hydrolase
MAEIVLFHHALGLTSGCLAFADRLREPGHVVHTPDLYDGNTFTVLDDGLAYANATGFDAIIGRGAQAAEALPAEVVYAGFSLGVLPAQMLAQNRPGARGALLLHSTVPPAEFGGPWPAGLRAQIHTKADDGWGDVDIAREFAAASDSTELFLYPGDTHLFTDNSTADYDADAADLVVERVLAFLAEVG